MANDEKLQPQGSRPAERREPRRMEGHIPEIKQPHEYREERLAARPPEPPAAPVELDPRAKMRLERMARVRSMKPPDTVRVTPTSDRLRKLLRHPMRGVRFRETGSVEWPLDNFTMRRIQDGDVTVEKRAPVQRVSEAAEKRSDKSS